MDLNCNLIRFDFSSLSKFCHSNKSFRLIFKSKELRERPVGLLTVGAQEPCSLELRPGCVLCNIFICLPSEILSKLKV